METRSYQDTQRSLPSFKTIKSNGTMENPLHAERSPPSFRTIRTPTSCLLYHCNTLHTQGILLPSRTIGKKMDPNSLTKQTLVQHRQNTSWEPATVVSQSSSNSYWIMQENGTDQPRVYRRTRSMLKIRCTDVQQTRHNYCYIVGLGLNCKFIDLLFKRSVLKFIKISSFIVFIVSEIIYNQTDTLTQRLIHQRQF